MKEFMKFKARTVLISGILSVIVGVFYYVFSLIPQDLPQQVFFFDAQDIDATGGTLNELPNNTPITGWIDKFRGILAFQQDVVKAPLYVLTSINVYPSMYFWGDRFLNVLEDWNISLSWDYPQKSFVMIFKTSWDISSFQNLYDEGTAQKWFSIQLVSGHIFWWIWNFVDWTWVNLASVDMGPISGDSVYTLVLVFDSLSWTLAGYIDGQLKDIITGLNETQTNHGACRFDTSFWCALFTSGGSFSIGATKNWSVDLANSTVVVGFEDNVFKGYIWEIQTYNYTLTEAEISGITLYLFEKWGIDKRPPMINSVNIASGSLLPGKNHMLQIFYSDTHPAAVGIDTWSAKLDIWKWQSWSGWNLYIANLAYLFIDTGEVNYNLSLPFGRYLLDFKIADRAGNYTWRQAQIWIDEPQMFIFTWEIDFGDLLLWANSSPPIVVNVYTVGAPFEVYLIKQQDLTYQGLILPDYSWWVGRGLKWWVDIYPLSVSRLIMSGAKNLNMDGVLNIYSWTFNLEAIIDEIQAAGIYSGSIKFDILLSY